ncbi:hypothetical protein APR12_001784 [Nocardia amikacinitolerans]|uniref:hypothetical protein n=1 Tax=Nocardia amikacinitolerans TaxID=756689 RepID=UPI0008336E84|nr:hypothetical protein [Nocardia amikacinitolerans]MCP2316447.1 hypothetical protein [Nocardia amikacinitolerans]
MTFAVGDRLTFPWRPDDPVVVDDRMLSAAIRARAALIAVAITGQTITYKGLSRAIGGLYPYRKLGGLLDVLSLDCENRGERSLAALVVRAGTPSPSSGFVHNATEPIVVYQSRLQHDWRR